jgi:Cu2+-exporting ATPase
VLSLDGRRIEAFRFVDHARADAADELQRLSGMGYSVSILSGDHPEKVSKLALQLGLPAEAALGAQSPTGKADWIAAHDREDTLMLGDGANDSLAFDKAFCRGTPVIHRGMLEQRADFYYLGRGISGIRALFEIDRIRRRTQVAIIVFSIAYNLLAVGTAVAGFMNPLIAAVIMPLNSLLGLMIVSSGMRGAFKPS